MQEQKRSAAFLLTALCGTVLGLASVAQATDVINVSGATLLENLVKGPASTNDWLDPDEDSFCGNTGTPEFCTFDPDQLAIFDLSLTDPEQFWVVQYRVVGSVNGFQELVDWGRPFYATATDDSEIDATAAALAYHNRQQYIIGGVTQGIGNGDFAGDAPIASSTDGNYAATDDPMNANGAAVQIDVSPLDVPPPWAVQTGSTSNAAFDRLPLEDGYGKNPRVATDKSGNPNGLDQLLATLGGLSNPMANRNLFDGDPGSGTPEDSNTIFTTSLSFAPIAVYTNPGTGIEEINMSDLRYSVTTGRLSTGENLIQITRDSGSGTRNGYVNSLGIDPSWGIGEAVGPLSVGSAFRIVGEDYLPSNKGGSSELEGTLRNTRIGLGYSGAERFNSSSRYNYLQLAAVRNDVDFANAQAKGDKATSNVYTRPHIDAILDNTIDGFRIGGPASLATIGDPRSSLVCEDGVAAKGNDPANTNPAMSNRAAAEYLNNITRSLENFVSVPASPDNELMPGELIATLIIPPTALDYYLSNINDPTSWTTPNPLGLNQNLQDEVRSISVLGNARFYTYGFDNLNGRNPTRKAGIATYSDAAAPGGSATGNNYVNQAGNAVNYDSVLDDRNRVGGDFSGDGARDWTDIPEMMKAYDQRHGSGAAWAAPAGTMAIDNGNRAGSFACIEILGDFNCDGSFDEQDIRYFADGLAVDPTTRVLSRVEGFTRVDNASAATKAIGDLNFFGTGLKNMSATYDAGDSRADVAGSGGHTRNFQPIGQDGMIDGQDIDYVFANFGDWSVLTEAIEIDLSCDMNDDFVVDINDVCTILGILETSYGDVDLNGVVDAADRQIIVDEIALSTGSGWEFGDIDGDGDTDSDDLDLWDAVDGGSDPCSPVLCIGDLDNDNDTDVFDFNIFAPAFGSTGLPPFTGGDLDGDGDVDVFDFNIFAPDFGCPSN